jgi:predicted phage tail protein
MIAVKLYGHLGKRFGRVHRLDIRTPAEAIRALSANFSDFSAYLRAHSAPGYRVITDSGERGIEQLHDPMGGASIKIVPLIAGAGNGVGQFILGAVLVAADIFMFHTGYLTHIGIAMMVGGVSQMLFAPPVPQGPNNGKGNLPSYAFSGPVNTTAQGNPVPVCYGRLLVGSQVISGGMYAAPI